MGKLKSYLKNRLSHLIKNLIDENNIKNNIAGAIVHQSAKVTGSLLHGNVTIDEGVCICNCTIAGNNISIGKFSSINGPNTTIYSEVHSIKIGNFCSIARNVDIQEWNHPVNKLSTSMMETNFFGCDVRKEMESKGGINIGHDVWIGTQTVILSGVTIGNGAIIGANSLVSSDIPPFAIAVGNPAKVIKYRFSAETITKINEMEWWHWDIDKIKANKDLFTSSNAETIV